MFGKKTEFGEGEKKSNLYNFANECPSTLIRVKKNKSRFQMGGIDKDMQIEEERIDEESKCVVNLDGVNT